MCPLNRPINLDEALAAPSQIFPSAYFLICLLPPLHLSLSPSSLPSVSPPHSKMEKSCYNSCGRFLAMYTAEWRNIYTMGYGDDSAQFVSLRQGMTFPFPPLMGKLSETNLYMFLCIYTHTHKNIYKHTVCKYCCGFRRS